jgi:hypothetical protein
MHIKDASGRATCQECSYKISAGTKQVGETRQKGRYETMLWFHPACFISILNERLKDADKDMKEILEIINK